MGTLIAVTQARWSHLQQDLDSIPVLMALDLIVAFSSNIVPANLIRLAEPEAESQTGM